MNINEMNSENTPKRWRILGKHLTENDPEQLDKLDINYKAVLEKAATFTSPAELGVGNQPGIGSEPDPILITGITLVEQDGTEIKPIYDLTDGTNLNIKAIVTPSNASNKKVVFTSSDTDIARITPTYGLIELINVGVVEITATAEDGSGITSSIMFEVINS